jgi:ubiquinone/menaquinone biosynthesis C-methylase UbiE
MERLNLPFEQQAYEIEDLWKEENVSEADIERVKYLAKLIPKDVKTILDVGCGGGIFVNYLKLNYNFLWICGVDRAINALKYVKTEKKAANIERLPFDNEEFDMVTCLEVLEHLPPDVYEKALRELCRVCKKYVLICVPNNQVLEDSLLPCPVCYTKFNPDYHMRSFNSQSMVNLFERYEFNCMDIFYILETREYLGFEYIQRLRRDKEKKLPWYAICPVCGYRGDLCFPKEQMNKLNYDNCFKKFLKKRWPKRIKYRWIAGLYEKCKEE